MATSPITFNGSSNGIDVSAIVSQLMQVESQPLATMKQQETGYQSKISAYGTLLAAVNSFDAAVRAMQNSTTGRSASVSDSSYVTATASNSAVAGTTSLQIGTIASAQSVYSLRFGSQTQSVANLTGSATQKIKIQVGGTSKEISIDSTNNNLTAISNAINGANIGVTASIIKEADNFVIDSSNNAIVYNDGTADRTATIATGTYSGNQLAGAIQTALNNATGTTNTFSVDYGSTASGKFSIQNTSGPDVTLKWGEIGSTAQQMLGFAPNDSTVTAGMAQSADDSASGSYRLTLVSNATGTANRITLKVDENNDGNYSEAGTEIDKLGLSALAFNPTYDATTGAINGGISNMSQSQVGIDSKFKVNGLEISRSTNSISDVITGVTLSLLKADPNYSSSPATVSVTVSDDTSPLTSKLGDLVSSYNTVKNAITSLYGDQNSIGILSGDALLTSLSNSLNNITVQSFVSGGGYDKTLSAIGVTHDQNGKLTFDSTQFANAYKANASQVVSIMNNMASSVDSLMTSYSDSIPQAQAGYQQQIKDVQAKEADFNTSLKQKQASLTEQYNALNNLLTKMQGTSNYLTMMFSNNNNNSKV